MVRARKQVPSLDTLFFSTPEQKVVRLLLSEPTSTFSVRTIASRLKGVRGLGGVDGINEVLENLHQVGLLDYVDNKRGVRLRDEGMTVRLLKTFSAICDLEGLRGLLEPISTRGVLFGPRAEGEAETDGEYDLLVVTQVSGEVEQVVARHPLSKLLRLTALSPEAYSSVDSDQPELARRLGRGVVLWGSSW